MTCPQRIRELIEPGVDVVRLNFSHGTTDAHAKVYEAVRDAERLVGKPVAVMLVQRGRTNFLKVHRIHAPED